MNSSVRLEPTSPVPVLVGFSLSFLVTLVVHPVVEHTDDEDA
jgi:hypothetical protein